MPDITETTDTTTNPRRFYVMNAALVNSTAGTKFTKHEVILETSLGGFTDELLAQDAIKLFPVSD